MCFQIFITCRDTPHLDGKHVVFGKILEGLAVMREIEALPTEFDKPTEDVIIVDCGELAVDGEGGAGDGGIAPSPTSEEPSDGGATEAENPET